MLRPEQAKNRPASEQAAHDPGEAVDAPANGHAQTPLRLAADIAWLAKALMIDEHRLLEMRSVHEVAARATVEIFLPDHVIVVGAIAGHEDAPVL